MGGRAWTRPPHSRRERRAAREGTGGGRSLAGRGRGKSALTAFSATREHAVFQCRPRLDASLVAEAYATRAAADSSAALDAPRDVEDRRLAETIAAALLPVLGNDDLTIARIAGAVPRLEPPQSNVLLMLNALSVVARTDPDRALDAAL